MTLKEQIINDVFDTEYHNAKNGNAEVSLLIAMEKACHPDASLKSKMAAFDGMCILVDSVREDLDEQ
jgi:hypothetical protein